MQVLCYNGAFLPAEQPLFTAQNRSFRYGDGIFETMKFANGQLLLAAYHFDRFFTGLQLLRLKWDASRTPGLLTAQVAALCEKNNCTALARVRLAAFRTSDDQAGYVIEANPLHPETQQWNREGWTLEVYPFVRKSCDAFANLKSANYLPYVLAGAYAKEKGVSECLVLNSENALCDGSRTNLFLLVQGELYTPALNQGCVSGVMRRYVIDRLKNLDYAVHQTAITEEKLLAADEVFCTNALEGMRWVRRFRQKTFAANQTGHLYAQLFPDHL